MEVVNDDIIPFSSERKFSACKIGNTSYYVGAPEYVLSNQKELIDEEITKKQNDYLI